MGIRIIKAGVADSIQDAGRYGFQHLGIPPGGVMDPIAFAIANALVGNNAREAVLEMHFPAATILFESGALIALAGADFSAHIDGTAIQLHQPFFVPANSVLSFTKNKKGARVYLAVRNGFVSEKWLGSNSTQLLVRKGGYQGRHLQKNDLIAFHHSEVAGIEALAHLPWTAVVAEFYAGERLAFIAGAEYHLLDKTSQKTLTEKQFAISTQSNRMGYRLQGEPLLLQQKIECLSSAVSFGTMQLLPNAQMIVLMADHQTTGGYPRVGHVAGSSLPILAQAKAGDRLLFNLVSIEEAETVYLQQQHNLQQLQNACNFRLQDYFSNE